MSIREDLMQIRKIYPEIDKISIIGVSYGSILAHTYSQMYADEVNHLIDYSGGGSVPGHKSVPILYVYGKNDTVLDSLRVQMIRADVKRGNGAVFELEQEGHSILKIKNREAALKKTVDFLTGSR